MSSINQFLLAPLFIKPLVYPGTILFSKHIPILSRIISFRSFDIETDLDMVYQWVNMEYALKYWLLDGPKQRVYDTYYNIQRNSNTHSYIGLLDGEPVCQIDIYRVLSDEINQYILAANEHDCGFHLLMSPKKKQIHGLTTSVIDAFLEYYFSFPEARCMYGEPDIRNKNSNRLLQNAGFRFIHSILMSYKTANLYCLTRDQFEHNTYRNE